MPDTPIRILIVVRAGRESLHHLFASESGAFADIAVSTFEDVDWSGPAIKYTHFARGGKFQGIYDFLTKNPQLLDAYDYFWCFEDDLEMPRETLAAVHGLLTRFKFMLAAPGLTLDSHFSWTITVRNDRLLFRGTNFVEIMAPIMSRAFMRLALPHFAENFTGYGYEWLWQRLLADCNGFAAILDCAPIRHVRPRGGGMLYKNQPSGSSDGLDLHNFVRKFGLHRQGAFRNLFALTLGPAPRLLTRNALTHEMMAGYRQAYPEDSTKAAWWGEQLIKNHRPVEQLEALRGLAGFDRIEAAAAVAEAEAERPVAFFGRNLAFGQKATQSSVCEWSPKPTPEADARGANNGDITGAPGFHTGFEAEPWWQVDLGAQTMVALVVVYNRMAFPERCTRMTVSGSADGVHWALRGAKLDGVLFGGVDGHPYIFRFSPPFPARFVRVAMIGEGFLHLDEVEIYGPDIAQEPGFGQERVD